MKILIVAGGNSNAISPYVRDQANALAAKGVAIDYFLIKGVGMAGYLRNRRALIRKIDDARPDLIHAHYGLSGLLANLQRKVPVVTTYHGSDIAETVPFVLSTFSIRLSRFNIFVSEKLAAKARVKANYSLVPCGVDLDTFTICDRSEARRKMGLAIGRNYVLFSSAFANPVKNYPLAAVAMERLNAMGGDAELVEFKGFSREETNLLINAVDCVLVTSFRESGPLVVKEAMAVNTCAVSVNVGDVAEIIHHVDGYYLAGANPKDVADKIKSAISFGKRPNGRERIVALGLDNRTVAGMLCAIYERAVRG